jgi:ubiquinone/menaquinone biosynthesis C-methylase UbiE
MTEVSKEQLFAYKGYRIPIELIDLTGGGIDTWEAISVGHMEQYAKYAPIDKDASVLEVGCGVGRDAIQLAEHLSSEGAYVGIDIVRASIEWCQANITPRYPNFTFHYLDIKSQIYSAGGSMRVQDIKLPLPSASVDRVILQSVFTHMFYDDIIHYLKEFRRILKPGGKVVASFFVIDEESRRLMEASSSDPAFSLNFAYPYGEGCFITDKECPEGAVAFTPQRLDQMLAKSGMAFDQPIHHGFWCGRQGVTDGQDITVLKVGPALDERRSLLDRLLRRG